MQFANHKECINNSMILSFSILSTKNTFLLLLKHSFPNNISSISNSAALIRSRPSIVHLLAHSPKTRLIVPFLHFRSFFSVLPLFQFLHTPPTRSKGSSSNAVPIVVKDIVKLSSYPHMSRHPFSPLPLANNFPLSNRLSIQKLPQSQKNIVFKRIFKNNRGSAIHRWH